MKRTNKKEKKKEKKKREREREKILKGHKKRAGIATFCFFAFLSLAFNELLILWW